MEDKARPVYNPVIDWLRIMSIWAVVMIHTTTRTMEATHFDLVRFPWTLFLNQISRFAVPLFFLLSGWVLELNYPATGGFLHYFKKRISRIFFPYVFWSLIYITFVYVQHSYNFINILLTGNASYQLYFIPALLIFYLVFPLIHKYFQFFANKWVLVILGLLQFGLVYHDYFYKSLPVYYPVGIALLNFFPFLLGAAACHKEEYIMKTVAKWKQILIPAAVILGFLVFWEGRSRYLATHNYLAIYSQWRPSVLLYTIILFAVTYFIFRRVKLPVRSVYLFSKLSFFVFFIHVIWIEMIWKNIGVPVFKLAGPDIAGQFWYDPVFFILATGASFASAYIVHKIPYLSKLTG